MHCAICDQAERVTSAVAVCQRCGSGVCRTHLHTFIYAGAPGGMAGVTPPRRECVCHFCARETFQDMGGLPAKRPAEAALPDAEALIQTVEALLHGSGPTSQSRPGQRWRKLWQAMAARVQRHPAARARPGAPVS